MQEAIHEFYREKGVPENTELVTWDVGDLPFASDHLDAVFSTMTCHEFAGEQARSELGRVLSPGGRLVIADWAADGTGEHGPPLDERYATADVTSGLEAAGFEIEYEATRSETLLVVGVTDE